MTDVEVRVATRRADHHACNQDRALVAGRVHDHEPDVVTTRTCGPMLVAVLDGLGGHLSGEVASELAARQLATADPRIDAPSLAALLRETDEHLHAAGDEPDRGGMGTTVALLALGDDSALVANVGDSSVWRVTPTALEELSISDRAYGSTITQCLGANSVGIEPHVRRIELTPGDRFLVATDGLTDVVAHATIASTLAAGGVERAVQQLIDAVGEQGPPDDVTILVLDVLGRSESS